MMPSSVCGKLTWTKVYRGDRATGNAEQGLGKNFFVHVRTVRGVQYGVEIIQRVSRY